MVVVQVRNGYGRGDWSVWLYRLIHWLDLICVLKAAGQEQKHNRT